MGEKKHRGGCLRYIFMFFNVIFLVIGLALIGYMVYVLATVHEMSDVIAGNAIFTYLGLGLGAFVTLTGCIGCCAAVRGSTCCFKIYIAAMILFLIGEIGGLIYIFAQQDKILGEFLHTAWKEVNQDTRDILQTKLQCCGYNGTIDTFQKIHNNNTIVASCYNSTVPAAQTLYTYACKDAIIKWFNDNIPIWAATLGILVLLEILAILSGGFIIRNIKERKRYEEDQEMRQPTHSRLEQYDDEEEGYPDVTYRGHSQSLLEKEHRPPPYDHPVRDSTREYSDREPVSRPPPENPFNREHSIENSYNREHSYSSTHY